ncbi:hypothetical protein DFJ74DRAFT_664324 [Hyaloraphidium curvatum]|nr:hypothetical protein DFJ74DRAFT_664324 [Hyaloraphidium curvatum]
MPRPPRMLLLLTMFAALLISVGTAAAPGPVFKRSCGECGKAEFCEFSYPGTPEDHVACVRYADLPRLYRRYAAPPGQATLTMLDVKNGGGISISTTDKAATTTLTISNAGNAPMTITQVAGSGQAQLLRRAAPPAFWRLATPTPSGAVPAGLTTTLIAYCTYSATATGSAEPTATFTVLVTNAAGDLPVDPTAYTFTATGRVGYTTTPTVCTPTLCNDCFNCGSSSCAACQQITASCSCTSGCGAVSAASCCFRDGPGTCSLGPK